MNLDGLEAKMNEDALLYANPFPFLKLPPDIRNIIYDLVLVSDHHINISCCRFGHNTAAVRLIRLPNPLSDFDHWDYNDDIQSEYVDESKNIQLFTVCKQVAKEAMSAYYGGNNFIFRDTSDFVEFIEFARSSALRAQLENDFTGYCQKPVTRAPLEDLIGGISLYRVPWALDMFVYSYPFLDAVIMLNSMPKLRRLNLWVDYQAKERVPLRSRATLSPYMSIRALLCIRNITHLNIAQVKPGDRDRRPAQAEKDEVFELLQVLKSKRETRLVAPSTSP